MQYIRAMAVEHALRISGCAGGVAEAARRVLVELLPSEILASLRDEILIRQEIWNLDFGEMRAIRQRHVEPDRRNLPRDLLNQLCEGDIEEQGFVFGVIGDVSELVGKQPRVQRVIDGADPGDAVPRLDVPRGVPGKRRDAVAKRKPGPVQRISDCAGAACHVAIIRAPDWSFDASPYGPAV